MSAAPKNQYTKKFKTPEARMNAFLKYCKHVSEGYSQASFNDPCTIMTIKKMIKDHADEFTPEVLYNLDRAKGVGIKTWEKVGHQGAKGRIKNFNAQAYKLIMQNKHGWSDKSELTGKDGGDLAISITRTIVDPTNKEGEDNG